MSRPVTIHSDGTGRGTVVLDEDGKPITDISSLSLNVDARGFVEVTIEVTQAQMNVQGNITEVVFCCPLCVDMHSHHCDPSLGGAQSVVQAQCHAHAGISIGGQCIRNEGHDQKHFDGVLAWA